MNTIAELHVSMDQVVKALIDLTLVDRGIQEVIDEFLTNRGLFPNKCTGMWDMEAYHHNFFAKAELLEGLDEGAASELLHNMYEKLNNTRSSELEDLFNKLSA